MICHYASRLTRSGLANLEYQIIELEQIPKGKILL
ncbi:hypothetical protein CGERO_05970 [Corynebacterium gerontici]|uniref:Uncharacterized protein n=1 Tax=Corynebacterium gerontici TaxID=2079234 RepID=A0A3G6J0D5_9CORY|nr:hypothetical protein CGERO_05970 [Corynebacterium gerontici]